MRRYHSNVIFQGLRNAQTFPNSATTYPMPTHQIIQMKTGEMLSIAFSVPKNPASSSSANSATDAARTTAPAILLVRTAPSAGTRRRSKVG